MQQNPYGTILDLPRDYYYERFGTLAKELTKILPDHLKYVFLEEDKPIVISNALTAEEENRLVDVLKKHKEAIG